jgi:hypothetical protein
MENGDYNSRATRVQSSHIIQQIFKSVAFEDQSPAARKMEEVDVRSRAITRKLRDVEELPENPQPLFPELLSRDDEVE